MSRAPEPTPRKKWGGGVRIPPGATLRTCPQGHPTCWPAACPTCRAKQIPFVSGNNRQKVALQAYWADYWKRKAGV